MANIDGRSLTRTSGAWDTIKIIKSCLKEYTTLSQSSRVEVDKSEKESALDH